MDKVEAPFVPASFINAIDEEGTKDDAVQFLQKTWNELCQCRAQLAARADVVTDPWMDIETAPKDGTPILGFGIVAGEINGPFAEPHATAIYWGGGRTDWAGYEWAVSATDAYAMWMNPTHWMPLPQPPRDA